MGSVDTALLSSLEGRTLMYCGFAFSAACRDTLILPGSPLFEHIR